MLRGEDISLLKAEAIRESIIICVTAPIVAGKPNVAELSISVIPPAVHHVPEQVQPFNAPFADCDYAVVYQSRKLKCTFHCKTVGADRSKNIIHNWS